MEIKLFYINLFINILTFLHRGWKKHSLLCKQTVDHRKAKSPNLVSVLEREKKMFVPEELVNVPCNTQTQRAAQIYSRREEKKNCNMKNNQGKI